MRNDRLELLTDDWEIVSRETHNPLLNVLSIALQVLCVVPPATWSSVTWTLRQISTDTVHAVTAHSKEEAKLKVGLASFDENRACSS